MQYEFHKTLQSNASLLHYPQNKPGSFTFKLDRFYELYDYEVGIAEYHFPQVYDYPKDGRRKGKRDLPLGVVYSRDAVLTATLSPGTGEEREDDEFYEGDDQTGQAEEPVHITRSPTCTVRTDAVAAVIVDKQNEQNPSPLSIGMPIVYTRNGVRVIPSREDPSNSLASEPFITEKDRTLGSTVMKQLIDDYESDPQYRDSKGNFKDLQCDYEYASDDPSGIAKRDVIYNRGNVGLTETHTPRKMPARLGTIVSTPTDNVKEHNASENSAGPEVTPENSVERWKSPGETSEEGIVRPPSPKRKRGGDEGEVIPQGETIANLITRMYTLEKTNREMNAANRKLTGLGYGAPDYHFIYCDLVEPSQVGNKFAPFLRVSRVPPYDKYSLTGDRVWNDVHYYKLARSRFDSIEIYITDENDKPVSFAGGVTIVTLHFRKRRPVV